MPGSSNTIANLLSRCIDLNKGVNTKEPCILLPDHLFSNITNTHLQKTFLEDNEQTCQEILRKIHNSQAGGHPRIANTWKLVRQHYKGPRLQEFVEEYIKGCAKCQELKTNLPRQKAPLQWFNVPATSGPFQYVSMDLITDLSKSDGFNLILTIVIKDALKRPSSFHVTKQSMDQVLPMSIWNTLCPGLELHRESYLIEILALHLPFHKHYVVI